MNSNASGQIAGKGGHVVINGTTEVFLDEYNIDDHSEPIIDKSFGINGVANVDAGFGDGTVTLKGYLNRNQDPWTVAGLGLKSGTKLSDTFLFLTDDLFYYFPSLEVLDAKIDDPQDKRCDIEIMAAIDGVFYQPGDDLPDGVDVPEFE